MTLYSYILIVVFAFLFETIDGSIGMGYGTILTPVLLLMGLDPLQVVPAVLVSQLSGDFLATLFHHRFKNVDLSFGSKHFKIAVLLSTLSLAGSVIGVAVMISLPSFLVSLYIGALFALTGLIVLITIKKNYKFSRFRLFCLGSLAAFNKGISGGGYGPIVTTGQILAGIKVRPAIAIISLSEGITCAVAVLMYVIIGKDIDWLLSIALSIGVVSSTPLTALIVRKVESQKLRLLIGTCTLVLGLSTIAGSL